MATPPIVQPATNFDIPSIRQLAEVIWWPTYSPILSAEQIRYMLGQIYSHEELNRVITSGEQTFLLIKEGKEIRGFASYGLDPEYMLTKLYKIYVHPDDQGKGFGLRLMEVVKDSLLRRDNHSLILNVNRFNPAYHFYKKIGFSILKEVDIPFGPYWMNDYVMQLDF